MKLYSIRPGFKAARTTAHLTQQQVADQLNVSLKTVMNWEQGIVTPSLETTMQIADLLRCDMDFLTGRIQCSTHDIQFIHDQTGLSENAIKKLQDQRQLPYNTADTLSRLIDHRLFVKLMQTIRKLIFGAQKTFTEAYMDYLSGKGPYVDNPDDITDQAHFEIYRLIANMTDDLK